MGGEMDETQEESSTRSVPGELTLVQDFVNTLDIQEHTDDLRRPEDLRAWLSAHGLPGGDEPLGEADLGRALEAREALRALLEANNSARPEDTAGATLNRISTEARLQVQFDQHGHAQLVPATSGVDGALGRLLAIAYTAMTDGTWIRLKACRNETCRWAFYDHSKNRSAAWCNMAVCGCRIKARTYRRRRRRAAETA
jgi:predicted RNA-binding Zn ribbon-like protein